MKSAADSGGYDVVSLRVALDVVEDSWPIDLCQHYIQTRRADQDRIHMPNSVGSSLDSRTF
jgi:hypothetical protein